MSKAGETQAEKEVLISEKQVVSATYGSTENDQELEVREVPDCARAGISEPDMLRQVVSIAIPIFVGIIFMFATQAITMSYVGHRLGFEKLAQFTVGLSVYNILGASIGIGFCGALDTLAPQAYGKNPKTPELGILAQRAFVLNALLLIPLTIFYFNSYPLLRMLYSEDLAQGVYEFLTACPLYLFLSWTASIFNRVFPAQHLSSIPLYGSVAGSVVAVLGNQYLLHPDSSIRDVVNILTLTQIAVNLVFLFTAFFHPSSILSLAPFPTVQEVLCWKGLKEFLSLGFASAVATCCEWWTYELVQVVCAQLGSKEVASFTILLNILVIFFSVSFSIGISAATLIGNCLGAGQATLAMRYMILTFKVGLGTSVVTFAVLYWYGLDVVKLYTHEPKILSTVKPLLHLFALWHLIDNAKAILTGVYRGCGFQKQSATAGLVCLWGIGLTATILFAIKPYHFGMEGILGAQILGVLLLSLWLMYGSLTWDFKKLVGTASNSVEEF